jgi:hypothetical protein
VGIAALAKIYQPGAIPLFDASQRNGKISSSIKLTTDSASKWAM